MYPRLIWTRQNFGGNFKFNGGGGGIRTLARCDPAAGFQDQSLQPLGYASVRNIIHIKGLLTKENPHLDWGFISFLVDHVGFEPTT